MADAPAEDRGEPPRDGPHVKLDPQALTAEATAAALAHVLSRPDSIRQRAQNAATISSAVAAALVIAAVGQLAGDAPLEFHTIVLVVSAIALWTASAAWFIYAVAFGDKPKPDGPVRENAPARARAVPAAPTDTASAAAKEEPQAFYQPLVNRYETYANKVRSKMRWAARCSAVALLLTVVAVGSAIYDLKASDEPMRLTLSRAGTSTVVALCEWSRWGTLTHIEGRLPADAVGDAVVRVTNVRGHFKASGRRAKPPKPRACATADALHIRRGMVRGAIERG